jgi:hypothetical protein
MLRTVRVFRSALRADIYKEPLREARSFLAVRRRIKRLNT